MKNQMKFELVQGLLSYPQPRPYESLESWRFRTAIDNHLSHGQNTPTFITSGNLYNIDYDFIDRQEDWFRRLTAKLDPEVATLMVFSRFRESLGARWKYWATPTRLRRYCPLCYADDDERYLRLWWRLNFVVVCPQHDVFMESRCKCGALYNLEKLSRRYRLDLCWRCGYALSETKAIGVDQRDPGAVAIKQMLRIVLENDQELLQGGRISAPELFDTISLITCFVVNSETRLGTGSQTWGRYTIQSNEAYCLAMIGRVWSMLTDRNQFTRFIRDNQRRFNIRSTNSRNFPAPLLRYVRRSRPRRIDWSELFPVARGIARKGQLVSSNELAQVTGLKLGTVRKKSPPELWRYIGRLNSHTYEKLLSRLTSHVMSLQVCDLVKRVDAAAAVGWNRYSLMGLIHRRSDFRRVFADAEERRRIYYSTINCSECSSRGLKSTSCIYVIQMIRSPKGLRAVVGCGQCGTSSIVDVSDAPTHRAFQLVSRRHPVLEPGRHPVLEKTTSRVGKRHPVLESTCPCQPQGRAVAGI